MTHEELIDKGYEQDAEHPEIYEKKIMDEWAGAVLVIDTKKDTVALAYTTVARTIQLADVERFAHLLNTGGHLKAIRALEAIAKMTDAELREQGAAQKIRLMARKNMIDAVGLNEEYKINDIPVIHEEPQ